jgi:DNA-binding transcriptional regulator YhcF (GntR family)
VSHDKFQGVETAKELILKYVSERGQARWSDLQGLGIPKATLSRALRELINEGFLMKEKRGVYVLKEALHKALIQSEYAPRICDLIMCMDVEGLTNDLISVVGEEIINIEELHTYFINEYLKKVETSLQLPVEQIFKEVFKVFYKDRGFFTITMSEISKVVEGLLVMENCEDISLGLTEEAVSMLKNMISSLKKLYFEYLHLNEKSVNTLKKVREVIKKHGYRGIIKFQVLGFPIELDINNVITLSIATILQPLQNQKLIENFNIFYTLTQRFSEEGCRPLSTKEKEQLLKILQK